MYNSTSNKGKVPNVLDGTQFPKFLRSVHSCENDKVLSACSVIYIIYTIVLCVYCMFCFCHYLILFSVCRLFLFFLELESCSQSFYLFSARSRSLFLILKPDDLRLVDLKCQ